MHVVMNMCVWMGDLCIMNVSGSEHVGLCLHVDKGRRVSTLLGPQCTGDHPAGKQHLADLWLPLEKPASGRCASSTAGRGAAWAQGGAAVPSSGQGPSQPPARPMADGKDVPSHPHPNSSSPTHPRGWCRKSLP